MALVGDIIMSVRSIIPDTPGVLQPPIVPNITVITDNTSSLPPGNYYIRCTLLTPWGESSACAESNQQVVGNGQSIQVGVGQTSLPIGAIAYRVYFGPQGLENQYIDFTTLPATINSIGTAGAIPFRNNAFLPDTDGMAIPAITIYSWLKDALIRATSLIGSGIYDATGVNTTTNVAMYQLLGSWKKMSHAWVDGWPFELGNKGEIFYRNKVTTSGSGIVVTNIKSNLSTIEYYPVPDRTGGQSTTSQSIAIGDTAITVTDLSNFLLQYGLAQLGSGSNAEIIAYNIINGNQLTNCIRGIGGTRASAWQSGTSIIELNGRFAGYRDPILPRIGDANAVLDTPSDWYPILQLYMESRYRSMERKHKEAADMMKAFEIACSSLKTSNATGLLGPKQVGDCYTPELYNSGLGGGWLLP